MRYLPAFIMCLLLPLTAHASACRFGYVTRTATAINITNLYLASDLVVAGEVRGTDARNNLLFAVDNVIKGNAGPEIVLHGQPTYYTQITGFNLPLNEKILLFLDGGTDGVYDAMEDYNSPCNIITYIHDGKIVLIEPDEQNTGLQVPIGSFEMFMDSSTRVLLHNYQD